MPVNSPIENHQSAHNRDSTSLKNYHKHQQAVFTTLILTMNIQN